MILCLKVQYHKIFCIRFFSWVSFPPALEYPIRTISIFFENSRRYLLVKVHTRYQQHRCQCHRGQNSHPYKGHWQQIKPPVLLVLLIPVANLPPVSTIMAVAPLTLVAIATGINNTGGKFGKYGKNIRL